MSRFLKNLDLSSLNCLSLLYLWFPPTFFFDWLRWVFAAVRGLSLAVESRGYSVAAVGGLSMASSVAEHRQALEQVGFSSFGLRAPELGGSSCGAQAYLSFPTYKLLLSSICACPFQPHTLHVITIFH